MWEDVGGKNKDLNEQKSPIKAPLSLSLLWFTCLVVCVWLFFFFLSFFWSVLGPSRTSPPAHQPTSASSLHLHIHFWPRWFKTGVFSAVIATHVFCFQSVEQFVFRLFDVRTVGILKNDTFHLCAIDVLDQKPSNKSPPLTPDHFSCPLSQTAHATAAML